MPGILEKSYEYFLAAARGGEIGLARPSAAAEAAPEPVLRHPWPGEALLLLEPEQEPAADRVRLGQANGNCVAEREFSAGPAPNQPVPPGVMVIVIRGQRRDGHDPTKQRAGSESLA